MQLYILTREINQYDQDGAYYMDVYNKIPTKSELEQAIGDKISNKLYDHIIISGGGRIDNEYEWYYFKSKTI